jgi:hypothetical protein
MFLGRPLPIYAADAPIVDLRAPELFVLCIARLWVMHHRYPDKVPADWRAGFAHMHVDRDGEAGFERLFELLAASAVRSLDIRCKCCPRLGGDEAWLLQLVGALQGDRLAEAASIFADWLPAPAVRWAIGPGQSFAAGLAARGLMMPSRQAAAVTRRPATVRVHACTSDLMH